LIIMSYLKNVMYHELRKDIQRELTNSLLGLLSGINKALISLYKAYDRKLLIESKATLEEILDQYQNTEIRIFITIDSSQKLKEFAIPMVGRFIMNQENVSYYLNATEILNDYLFDLKSILNNKDFDHYYIGKRLIFLDYLKQCLENVDQIKLIERK